MPTPLPKYGTTDLDDVNLLENQQSNGESQQNSLTKLVTAFAVQAHVIARQNSPPAVIESAVYMVGDTPAGDWSAFDTDDLAIGLDGGWHELDPFVGLTIIREDLNNAEFTYDGATWVERRSAVTVAIAALGSTQGAAAALTTRINEVTTGTASSADGVRLPAALAGLEIIVINAHASIAIDVFPATGDDIDLGSVNVAVTLALGETGHFFAVDTTSWYMIKS